MLTLASNGPNDRRRPPWSPFRQRQLGPNWRELEAIHPLASAFRGMWNEAWIGRNPRNCWLEEEISSILCRLLLASFRRRGRTRQLCGKFSSGWARSQCPLHSAIENASLCQVMAAHSMCRQIECAGASYSEGFLLSDCKPAATSTTLLLSVSSFLSLPVSSSCIHGSFAYSFLSFFVHFPPLFFLLFSPCIFISVYSVNTCTKSTAKLWSCVYFYVMFYEMETAADPEGEAARGWSVTTDEQK
ncbi:hypothetical protein B0T24DRAFT_621481 [Lasiosphaeria ovina]|uniref:Uncharacterized protein n=1 Tax=Lasiosphaeria ovina TaxID=92902 RepID=A0AAE0K9X2_9PEZI|nr:hypothetical protein B0T24DRAFT_621481 [Lasiosphaeria ovina]